MARLVVAGVAAAIAGYFSGGSAAAGTFSLVYGTTGFLDPNSKVLGPRLKDLQSPQANYGVPWPYIEGAPRLAGNYIWASPKREIANTQTQGKGGPGVDSTTYTYEIDCGIGLSINEMAALRRAWAFGKLILTVGADTSDDSVKAGGGVFFRGVAKQSDVGGNTNWRALRFYGGSADQLPDPTYEAFVGVGNAPAYRGRCHVVIEGLNLGNSGQLPIITFEVLSEVEPVFSTPELSAVVEPFGITSQYGLHNISTPAFTSEGYLVGVGQWTSSYTNGDIKVYRVSAGSTTPVYERAFSVPIQSNALIGASDVDCYVCPAGVGSTSAMSVRMDNGVTRAFGLGESAFLHTFVRAGDLIAFASSGVTLATYQIKFFNPETGIPVGETADLGGLVQSMAMGGGLLYALRSGGASIEVYETATFSHVVTLPAPDPVTTAECKVVMADTGQLYYLQGGTDPNGIFGLNSDNTWELVADLPLASPIQANQYASIGIAAGVFYVQCGGNGSPRGYDVYSGSLRLEPADVLLSDVVRRLCVRTGQLTAADIDVTALEDDIVRAMPITQVSTTRNAIETLMDGYLFDWAEGAKLKAVKRGGAPVMTIPYSDLGASSDGKAEPFPKKRLNDIEIPSRVTVKYANVLNDFQDGAESGERLVTDSTSETVIELPLGLTPTEAKRLADSNTMDIAAGLLQVGPIALPRKYSALEPTDVVLIEDQDGSTYRCRIGKLTAGSGIITLELVLDDASVFQSSAETDSSYVSSSLVRLLVATRLQLLDIAPLTDAYTGPGFFAAASAVGSWPGAEIDESADDVTYQKVADATSRSVTGLAALALPNFTGAGFDQFSTLTVDVGSGELSSSTIDILLDSTTTNAMAVGTNAAGWEVIQFVNASLLSPGVYLLSGFLRGLRGTEWAMAGHSANETVVLLQPVGLVNIEEQQADIGIAHFYKAVTYGKSRASAISESFTDTGRRLKPFAPVDLRYDASGNVVWDRRSRLSSRFLAAGVEIPLGETSEAYDVDLYDAGSVFVSTTTVTVPSYTPPGSHTGYSIKVYQKSQAVGRGYVATMSL